MKYDIAKILRLFIGGLIFLSIVSMWGFDSREVYQAMFTMAIMALVAILMRNVWLTLFLWWCCFLFIFYQFQVSMLYMSNIFFGCLLYYLTKIAFKREHIDWYIRMMIIFVCVNLAYCVLQIFDLDFYYVLTGIGAKGKRFWINNTFYVCGFMGSKANLAMFLALCIPLVATRRIKFAPLWACGLFLPMWLTHNSTSIIAGLIGLLFVLFFKIKKYQWWSILVVGLIAASLYVIKVDIPMGMMGDRPKQWKVVMRDVVKHPIVGYGLDSFRHPVPTKPARYASHFGKLENGGMHITFWDNPHNLLISLAFEFGVIAWFLLGGYLRDCCIAFKRSIKSPNVLATSGFILVFFLLSMSHFPMWLAALAIFIIPMFALAEKALGMYGQGE